MWWRRQGIKIWGNLTRLKHQPSWTMGKVLNRQEPIAEMASYCTVRRFRSEWAQKVVFVLQARQGFSMKTFGQGYLCFTQFAHFLHARESPLLPWQPHRSLLGNGFWCHLLLILTHVWLWLLERSALSRQCRSSRLSQSRKCWTEIQAGVQGSKMGAGGRDGLFGHTWREPLGRD